ncbi:hypothetical protein EJV47_19570 [Hymenobacter gummosus]|uniref:DUF305 domain-containing protein n=1 Tax=Hymenobacter gummosus TaxID=1776032 RepID=A0A3S0H410_9BACT|nr:hypothetical protein [Hymenobacter gummosus]RTQ47098.1 hypothetical protein EJV47_19570 [Hymenobacter gummosus]
MTRYFLIAAAALLPLCSIGQAQAQTASTAQLESQLATEACQELTKQNTARPLAQLSPTEAMSTLQQTMIQVVMKHPQEVEKIMKANGADPSTAMREMGQRVATKLGADCPVAMALFTRMAEGNTGEASAADLSVSPEEQPLLIKLSTDICTDLSAQDAKKPLAKMPKAERMNLVQAMMEKHMKANQAALTKQYGPTFFQDMERIRAMGVKVGGLMAKQCPTQAAAFTRP